MATLNGTQQTGLAGSGTSSIAMTIPANTTTCVVLLISKSTASTGSLTGVVLNPSGTVPNTTIASGNPDTTAPLLRTNAYIFQNPLVSDTSVEFFHGAFPTGTNAGTRGVFVYLSDTNTAQVFGAAGVGANNNVANSGSGSPSVTLTVLPDGMVISGAGHEGGNIMTAKGTGQLGAGADADGFIDEGNWNSAFTYEPTLSAGSEVQSFTSGTSDTWAMASVFIASPIIPSLVMLPPRSLT